jgi:hypothetical protein
MDSLRLCVEILEDSSESHWQLLALRIIFMNGK